MYKFSNQTKNQMKQVFYLILLVFGSTSFSYSQDESDIAAELYFQNTTAYNVTFRIFPISMIFNNSSDYDLLAYEPIKYSDNNNLYYYYLNGTSVVNGVLKTSHIVSSGSTIGFSHDAIGNGNGCNGGIGWGKYKVIVSIPIPSEYDEIIPNGYADTCIIDWDFTNGGIVHDLLLKLKIINNSPQLYYSEKNRFPGVEYPITFVNKDIKRWQTFGPNPIYNILPGLNYIPYTKILGNFIFDNNSTFNLFPLDSRKECDEIITGNPVQDQNQDFSNNNFGGVLTLNLTIDKNISTPTSLPKNDIFVTPGAKLTLNTDHVFTLNKFNSYNYGTDMNVNQNGTLQLNTGTSNNIYNFTRLLVGAYTNLNLQPQSNLILERHSAIFVRTNGIVQICSPNITWGKGSIIGALGGTIRWNTINCPVLPTYEDAIINNGGSLSLDSSSTFIIGDSCNLIIDSDSSGAILKSKSNFVFGKGSKIIIRNGANFVADSCTFTTDTTSSLGGGIVLENAGNNTKISNCIFNNCKTAITIKDSGGVYNNCEISNNIFNIPSGGDYGIYAKDVNNKIIKGNIFNLPTAKTNSVGIYYKNIAQSDTTFLEIPDSTKITFKSKAASLSMLSKYIEIKMGAGATLTFDSATTFNAQNLKFTSTDTTKPWNGIYFKNMDTVIINKCEINNVNGNNSNSGYTVSMINTKNIDIDSSKIDNKNSSAGGIHIYYLTNLYMDPTINITSNTIKVSTDTCDGIRVTPYGWLTLSGYIYGNKIINTSSGGGRYGIYGFDLVATPIKHNYIENFENGILTWYSSLDLFENTIDTKNISNGWDLYGIVSEYNLSNAYESRLGGSNVLTTFDGRNICLDALDLNISEGNNIFNINDDDGYHMAGYFPTAKLEKQPANNNCFKIEGVSVGDEYGIRKDVTESNGITDVVFDFGSFNCSPDPNYCNFYLGVNTSDTVWIECAGGMGGGQKEGASVTSEENIYLQIYDSLSINMRKKQYELAAQKCMTLLDNYADSAKSINVVDKLYRTALAENKVSELKSYYESFIQNHPNHTLIIQRMFYYIQKAKAKLGQYESARTGFQTIMSQFPTSLEGLAARWDYMATELLSNGGNGGGEKEIMVNRSLTTKQKRERLVKLVEDPLDKYDKNKFSKNDRKIIVTNIVKSFESQSSKEKKKFNELKTKTLTNKATDSEQKEYKKKRKLQEIIKIQHVSTIDQHINAVQQDIKIVFESDKNVNKDNNSIVPSQYKLSQNYPNPFNPTTQINYEIKFAGFVSLKVYDLLGREIAELINEKQDAGSYMINFDASKYMLSSGIYFYRIKAGEFVDTKRMVLVK